MVTTGAGNDYESTCAGSARSPDVPVGLILDVPSSVVAEIIAADYDTALHARSSCDDAESQIECNDDGGAGTLSRLDLNGLEAGEYYFFVDGFSNTREGTATILFTVTANE